LLLGTLALYAPALSHDFVLYDDDLYVTENAFVRDGLSWQGLGRAFTSTEVGIWHPVTFLSHMLDVELFGMDPAGHHASSILLHAFNALLVFQLLARGSGAVWRSASVAALFAVHPLQVESVAWVAERKTLLCLFFWLLACLTWLAYARRPGGLRYAATAALVALALMAKPMAVTLPLVLLLLDAWPLARLGGPDGRLDPARLRACALEKLPLLLLSAGASAAVLLTQRQVLAENLPLGLRGANALAAYALYLLRTVWPAHPSVLYPHPGPLLPAAWVVTSAALLAALTAAALLGARRRPAVGVGWLWFVGTLVPVIGLVQVGVQGSADRYAYIPLVGLFTAAVWAVPAPVARGGRAAVAAGAALLLLTLGAVTRTHLAHWRDSVALFEQALRATSRAWIIPYPESPILHHNLAVAYAQQGRDAEATRHFRKALELGSDEVETLLSLGHALLRQGRVEEALTVYTRARAAAPERPEVALALSVALDRAGRLEEAADELERYLEDRPDDTRARVDQVDLLLRSGRYARALAVIEAAAAARPGDPVLANNLAWLLATAPDPDLRDAQRALRISESLAAAGPPDASRLDTQAAAEAAAGRFEAAVRTADEAAALAESRGSALLAAKIRERRALYASGRPYRLEAPQGRR
jgi:Flp pilus assembly protein TadD